MHEQFEPHPRVLTRIAKAFDENTSMKKTPMFHASRTPWNSFVRYLNWLQSNNYLECHVDGKDETYLLTPAGKELFDTLLKFLQHVRPNKIVVLSIMIGLFEYCDDIIDFFI